jgi:hypothetical protein
MRQAFHIFGKDVRYLWREICLLLSLAAALGWAETHLLDSWPAELLWTVAANYAIARVVHAEAIPGHNQFWVTRPYRWKNLLGAKILFILLFVNVPLFAAQWYMIARLKFSFAASLPGLIWSQVLMILCLSLPVAALAAITAGIAPFLFSEFIVLAIGFIGSSGMIRVRGVPLEVLLAPPGPVAVEWIRNSLAVGVLACVAASVLYAQYKNRSTGAGRAWAIGGAAVAVATYFFMPWSLAMGIQSRLSKQAFDGSSLRVTLDPPRMSAFPSAGRQSANQIEVVLPLAIRGIPAGPEVQADALLVALEAADGRTWKSRLPNVSLRPGDPGVMAINCYLTIDPTFFREESAGPVTVRAGLFLTFFDNAQSTAISLESGRENVMDGLQCGSGLLHQLYCRSVFHWPRRRVYAKFGEGDMESFTPFVSYSPFPASLVLNPFERHWVSTAAAATQATIITKEPLSHFRRDFEIRDVHLTDFTRGAKR